VPPVGLGEHARNLALVALELGRELLNQGDELAGDLRRRAGGREDHRDAVALRLLGVLALVPVAESGEDREPVAVEEP
jgi:hypothetical protein